MPSLLHSMDSKKDSKAHYAPLDNQTDLYVTDDSLNDFQARKMLSTGSLDALKHLKEQNIVVSLDDLESQGYTIIKPQPRWRRYGSAIRRYSTTFFSFFTCVGIGVLFYYLFLAKSEIAKMEPDINQVKTFINKGENFINEAEQTFNDINQAIKAMCKQFDFEFCSNIQK